MKNLFVRKAVALILAMAMVLSLGSVSVFAETAAAVDTSVLGLTSTSNYVRVMSDSILVMSHYDDSRYYVRSDATDQSVNTASGDISFGLFSVLSSADYELSYVDAGKNAPESVVKSVKDGYVLCQKDGAEDVYVPIVYHGTEVSYTDPGAITGSLVTDGIITNGKQGGIAGKASDDTANCITVGETAISDAIFPRWQLPLSDIVADGDATDCDEPFAVEANIYADGDAILQISVRTYVILQWLPNGDIMGMNSTSSTTFDESAVVIGNLERGRWHRLTVGYDYPRNRILIFADGKRLTNAGSNVGLSKTSQLNNTLRIGLADASVNGTIAIDDAVGYKGYHYTDDDAVLFTATSDITLDTATDTLTVNGNSFADAAACNEALKAAFGGTYAALLKSDLTPASKLREAAYVIANSASGRVYEYYNVTVNQSLTSALGLSSSSNYVRVMDESILVMSHYDDKRYYIRSDASTAADNTGSGDISFGLFSVLTSSEGYTLSYVDADKNVPTEVVESFKDGYVLCQLEGEDDIYIPIVHKANLFEYTTSGAGGSWGTDVSKGNKTAVGGKASADTSQYITVGTTAVASGAFPRYEYSLKNVVGDVADGPFTFETNVYADGDATLQISIRTYTVLQWLPNGEIWGLNTTALTTFESAATKIGELERGKWHRLTVGYDFNRNRVVIFADGVRLTNLGSKALSVSDQLNNSVRIGLADDSVSGTIAIDDTICYKGHYYPAEDSVAMSETAGMKLEDSLMIVNGDLFADVSAYNEAAKAAFGGTYAALLKSDLTPAESFEEAAVLIVNSATGRVYEYYDVSVKDTEEYSIVIDEGFGADTPVDSNISDDIKIQFYKFATNPVQSYHGAPEAGIGTKADDDYAYVITSANETIISGYDTPQIDLNRTVAASERYLTLEFDVYKENMNAHAAAFVVTDTGAKITIASFSAGGEVVAGGLTHVMDHEAKRWYKVACVIDTQEDTWSIYINGKLVEVLTKDKVSYDLHVESISRFAVYAYYSTVLTAEEIAAAKTAIDNYRIYTTAYNPVNDVVEITVSEPYILDSFNSLILTDSIDGIKKSDVASIINTNGLSYKVFADETCQTELADEAVITADSVIAVYSADGESYGYYRFSVPFVDDIVISLLPGEEEIMAVGFTNDVAYEYDLIIASYNGNKLEDVNIQKLVPYVRNENIITYNPEYTVKAFIWVGGTLKPVKTLEYTVEE